MQPKHAAKACRQGTQWHAVCGGMQRHAVEALSGTQRKRGARCSGTHSCAANVATRSSVRASHAMPMPVSSQVSRKRAEAPRAEMGAACPRSCSVMTNAPCVRSNTTTSPAAVPAAPAAAQPMACQRGRQWREARLCGLRGLTHPRRCDPCLPRCKCLAQTLRGSGGASASSGAALAPPTHSQSRARAPACAQTPAWTASCQTPAVPRSSEQVGGQQHRGAGCTTHLKSRHGCHHQVRSTVQSTPSHLPRAAISITPDDCVAPPPAHLQHIPPSPKWHAGAHWRRATVCARLVQHKHLRAVRERLRKRGEASICGRRNEVRSTSCDPFVARFPYSSDGVTVNGTTCLVGLKAMVPTYCGRAVGAASACGGSGLRRPIGGQSRRTCPRSCLFDAVARSFSDLVRRGKARVTLRHVLRVLVQVHYYWRHGCVWMRAAWQCSCRLATCVPNRARPFPERRLTVHWLVALRLPFMLFQEWASLACSCSSQTSASSPCTTSRSAWSLARA